MATRRRGPTARSRLLATLPPQTEIAVEIQATARKLGLLIDLHRVVARLRDLHQKPRRRTG